MFNLVLIPHPLLILHGLFESTYLFSWLANSQECANGFQIHFSGIEFFLEIKFFI